MSPNVPMSSDSSPRRFQAYNVGLAKTGTNSIASVFGRYRSGHEFMFQKTVQQIAGWQDGTITADFFKAYILERDRLGSLEMDSASFNHHYLHILKTAFPEAKFIFTIRDCYSWLNSILNMSLRYVEHIPDWMLRYSKFFIGYEIDRAMVGSVPETRQKLPKIVESLLSYWQQYNQRVLNLLPPERSLIITTDKISDNLSKIANLMAIPPKSLEEQPHHINLASEDAKWLEFLDREWLEELCSFYCGNLMKQFFPDLSAAL